MITDPIADLLTYIRNANVNFQSDIEMPHSKMKWEIVRILKQEGFIENCEVVAEKDSSRQKIHIKMKYAPKRIRVITGLKRISKPGRRIYTAIEDIKKYRTGFGITLLSTQKGILTGRAAFREKVGGEVLCAVW